MKSEKKKKKKERKHQKDNAWYRQRERNVEKKILGVNDVASAKYGGLIEYIRK